MWRSYASKSSNYLRNATVGKALSCPMASRAEFSALCSKYCVRGTNKQWLSASDISRHLSTNDIVATADGNVSPNRNHKHSKRTGSSGQTTMNNQISRRQQKKISPPNFSTLRGDKNKLPPTQESPPNNNNNNNNNNNKSGMTLTCSVPDAGEEITAIQHRLSQLPPLAPAWCEAELIDENRQSLYRDTVDLLRRIEISVKKGVIQPSRKHGREVSHILGQILLVLQDTAPSDSESQVVFRTCCRVLTLLRSWNLDLQAQHYDSAITAAARASLWKEASELFWMQIDPEASGYMPMDVSCRNPVGLYAIARYAQSTGGSTAEEVMDAVSKMCMVSPTDQDKYILAAGTALGLAGEWKACVDYLKNSYDSKRLGQSLIASAMYSCILCNRHDEAANLFNDLVDGPLRSGLEWQWGGGSDTVHPICRDLAMRAIGLGDIKMEGESARLMQFFREARDGGSRISVDALNGALAVCERDGNFEDAVAIMYTVIGEIKGPKCFISGSDLESIHNEENPDEVAPFPLQEELGEILSSVMRICNKSGRFGLSLLCCQLLDLELQVDEGNNKVSEAPQQSPPGSLEQTLFRVICKIPQNEDVLVSALVALCGLGCSSNAVGLYEMMRSPNEQQLNDTFSTGADECYQYAQSLAVKTESSIENRYESTNVHIHRLTATAWSLERSKGKISQKQIEMLAAATARTMRCCTDAGQPETGIYVADLVKNAIHSRQSGPDSSVRGAVTSFFGFNNWSNEIGKPTDELIQHDSVLSETIRAYRTNGWIDEALDLLVSNTDFAKSSSSEQWIQSTNEGLRTLIVQRGVNEALTLFRDIDSDKRNSETFSIIADGLAKELQWTEVEDLYHEALKGGHVTEHLALLTMKAVAASNSGVKMRVLRGIVKEASRVAGVDSKQWLKSRYWYLKQALPYHARLLMWWNDPSTSLDEELDMALQQFHERRRRALSPKDDVIKCILHGALRYIHETDSMEPIQSNEWLNLLLGVLNEARYSKLRDNHKFIDDVSYAFRALKGNAECVDFVVDAVMRGVVVSDTAKTEALTAAKEAGIATNFDSLFL